MNDMKRRHKRRRKAALFTHRRLPGIKSRKSVSTSEPEVTTAPSTPAVEVGIKHFSIWSLLDDAFFDTCTFVFHVDERCSYFLTPERLLRADCGGPSWAAVKYQKYSWTLLCRRDFFISVQKLLKQLHPSHLNCIGLVNVAETEDARLDCQCKSPCYVPTSPSVMDVTKVEDVEVQSSGDELDKFESDTDSQDTVIEGEAYKRMRSVAIKEKILHANEELFGSLSSVDKIKNNMQSDIQPKIVTTLRTLGNTSTSNNQNAELNSGMKSGLSVDVSNNVVKSRHFRNYRFSTNPDAPCVIRDSSCDTMDQLCSSDSSDNSDAEEVVLSDTSSSSDEATYIAPAAGFYRQYMPSSFKLHTIIEESCEESEKGSRGSTPSKGSARSSVSQSGSFRKDRTGLKIPKKINHKTKAANQTPEKSPSPKFHEHQNKITPTVNDVLSMATTRLQNYFRSGTMDKVYDDDDLTDESGGISSDDDKSVEALNRPTSAKSCKSNQSFYGINQDSAHNKSALSNKKAKVPYRSDHSPTNVLQASLSSLFQQKQIDYSVDNKENKLENTLSNSNCYITRSETENVSDEEAKYIMNHVMKHITNNNESDLKIESEVAEVSAALKVLESEIARLMLTVSPVSLSTGDPSSSCSSTIGSNNSDYGSDTLESCEETTSDDEPADRDPPLAEQNLEMPLKEHNDRLVVALPKEENVMKKVAMDNPVADETLYICKQLVASLKKIADSADASMVSDELRKAEADDDTAKQYIADQIVSLMQTVNASQNNSPLVERSFPCLNMHSLNLDFFCNTDRSDSDSPPLNDEKRCFKSKTPSESGSETTISASISIPSYDDSDRTPTESEISHEMDELYALLESSNIQENRFHDDADDSSAEGDDSRWYFQTFNNGSRPANAESSLLFGAASQLESLLPISIEERIAMYNNAFISKDCSSKSDDVSDSKMRINVFFPQPCATDSEPYNEDNVIDETLVECDESQSHSLDGKGVTSIKITSPHLSLDYTSLSCQFHTDSSNFSGSANTLDEELSLGSDSNLTIINGNSIGNIDSIDGESTPSIVTSLPKIMNPKEKASSENDLLVANYRAKSKTSNVFGTKSAGNISELENNKTVFRDTGYYSFKSSTESFLSLDDSTSRTSTTSLTQYRSLTSTETIPEEEESSCKSTSPAKISLSSGNIPFEVCGSPASKSSTLPLSIRGKLTSTSTGSHRTRSSFFSTSGVLRKLTLLRDESGTSLRSSPHGRMRVRYRTLSGGSEDGRHMKADSLPQISVSGCAPSGSLSAASSEKDSLGYRHEEDTSYHSRSQMSISSFGVRSGSVTSVYSAAGGGRYGTVTVTGDVHFSLKYNYETSTMEVLIKECRNLAPVDTKRDRSDPYVKVYLLPDRTKSGKRKTKVKKHTLNPVFGELLKFHVTISELERRTLWLSVWHSDRFGRNDFLGEVMLSLSHDTFETSELTWYPLQERMETLDNPVSYKGDLILALKFVPPDVTSRRAIKKAGDQMKGSLHVLVKAARDLMANGTSDPFCKSYLLPDKSKSGKQKTPVLKKTCHPKWNHTFVYEDVTVEDLRERCLELTIWDYDIITSNDFLGGVRLCLGTGKCQGQDVDWMDSMGEEVSLWYTMLSQPNMWVDGSLQLRSSMQNRKMS